MDSQTTRTLLQTARRATFPLALALTLTANKGFASGGDGYGYEQEAPTVTQLLDAADADGRGRLLGFLGTSRC